MTLNQNDSLTMSVHAHSDFFKVLGGAVGVEMGEWGVGSGEGGMVTNSPE